MYKKYFKRIIDFVASILLLPVMLCAMLIIWFIIKIDDQGTAFYNSPRLGKDGSVFIMYKFRTMKMNAPDIRNADGSTFNSKTDDRLTRIGKVLRKLSLDELPQIFNILKGDMSFVGPRPDLPEHINEYTENEFKKLTVRPGITGYNQAYFRNSISWKERLENDVIYSENVSLLFDFKIILVTIKSVLFSKNIFGDERSEIDGLE